MIALLVFASVCAVAGLGFAYRLSMHVSQQWVALQSRRLDLDERVIVLQETKSRPQRSPSIPPDLLRRVTRWVDPDAQDAERKAILDLYAEFADDADPWVKVRQNLSAEPRDDIPSDIFLQ
jgi:hypothetical protein